MSILLGILLYVLAIAFLCVLTGMNRLDGPEPRSLLGESPVEAAPATVPARSAHG